MKCQFQQQQQHLREHGDKVHVDSGAARDCHFPSFNLGVSQCAEKQKGLTNPWSSASQACGGWCYGKKTFPSHQDLSLGSHTAKHMG